MANERINDTTAETPIAFGESILIVDDDVVVRDMLCRLLARVKYIIHEVGDAQAALSVLQRESIAVAVVDVRMPGDSGLWLTSQIWDRFPTVAVVLVTGDDSVPPNAILRNVVGYLIKPFNPSLLIAAIADAVVWHRVASISRRG